MAKATKWGNQLDPVRIPDSEACVMSSNDKVLRIPAQPAVTRPSPADRFNIDREGPAKRAGKLKALQQQFEKLNEYCDETVAELRASLERTPPR
jgi:hypothetical protein